MFLNLTAHNIDVIAVPVDNVSNLTAYKQLNLEMLSTSTATMSMLWITSSPCRMGGQCT